MTRSTAGQLAMLVASVFLLSGCDQLAERAGIPNPEKIEAEGKAIGGACRHAGRGLEDCYQLNKYAAKPAIYAGWKEMNEYMSKNNMQAVQPTILSEQFKPIVLKKKKNTADTPDGEESENSDSNKDSNKH